MNERNFDAELARFAYFLKRSDGYMTRVRRMLNTLMENGVDCPSNVLVPLASVLVGYEDAKFKASKCSADKRAEFLEENIARSITDAANWLTANQPIPWWAFWMHSGNARKKFQRDNYILLRQLFQKHCPKEMFVTIS